MPNRRLIVALISFLLLIASPIQSGMAMAQGMNDSVPAATCDIPEPPNCPTAASQCFSTSVFGIISDQSSSALRFTGHLGFVSIQSIYQTPVADVLTPPPNLLS